MPGSLLGLVQEGHSQPDEAETVVLSDALVAVAPEILVAVHTNAAVAAEFAVAVLDGMAASAAVVFGHQTHCEVVVVGSLQETHRQLDAAAVGELLGNRCRYSVRLQTRMGHSLLFAAGWCYCLLGNLLRQSPESEPNYSAKVLHHYSTAYHRMPQMGQQQQR